MNYSEFGKSRETLPTLLHSYIDFAACLDPPHCKISQITINTV